MEGTIPAAGDAKHRYGRTAAHGYAPAMPHADPIRARLSADAPQAQVLSSLIVVAGAQAGLSVERIDDTLMALDLLLGATAGGAREIGLTIQPGAIEIAVSDVDAAWLDGRRHMLDVLVTAVWAADNGVRLRVER
jgi:hypothetical protein